MPLDSHQPATRFRARFVKKKGSILCASGVVSLTNVAMHVHDISFLNAVVGGSDAILLAPTSNAFQSTLRLSNVSMRFTSLASRGFRSLFANITGGTARTSNNMMFTKGPVFVSLPSCSSNSWDGGALSCADMLRPVDGQRAVDWSLVRMSVDDPEDTWCARCPGTTASLTLIEGPIETHSKARPSLLPSQPTQLTRTTAAVTTAALALAMLTSSSGVASVLPRLQGMVGYLKLASRCAAQSEAPPTEGSHEDASDSNYAANDVSDNPFLLRLPSTEPSLAYAAGALVGNTLLVIAVAVVSHLAHRWERWAHQELHNDESSNAQPKKDESAVYSRRLFLATISTTFCRVLPTTPLPASLMQLQGLLLQPVVAAAVACIASSDRGVLSVMLAVVIGSAWIAVPCVFMWLLCVKYSPLPLITIYSRRTNAQRMRWKRGGEALEWLCAEREEWVAARGRAAKAAARHVKLRLSAVFAGYRGGRHWYLGVDAFQSVLTGAIVGTAQSVDAADACSAVVWGTGCVGAMATGTAVLCVVLQPHVVRFELLAAVVVSLLAVLAAVLILADDVNGAAIVSLVAAAMELLPLAARLLWNACLRSRKSDDLIGSNRKDDWDVNSGSLSQVSPLIFSSDVSARGQRRESKTLSAVTVALSPSQEDALIALVECICGKSVSSLSI
ncbi:transmembrane protein, putative [Bodo saltans]|uniref:Transmembrane protein, putative n=1 Tax=Bodo saltans TaxID=75058 RepID=A0A0S4JH56_BODSA|nr:transmembrane protein, putative [Bodo saltans]|eukprot:CUG88350.1 transmembrane protein, putative [Bodo saltans]